MEIRIKLNSRSGNQHYLKQLIRKNGGESYTYVLETDAPSKVRVGKDYNKVSIEHIDPAGGPRIEVGKYIRDTELPKIKNIVYNKDVNKYIITFEENDN